MYKVGSAGAGSDGTSAITVFFAIKKDLLKVFT